MWIAQPYYKIKWDKQLFFPFCFFLIALLFLYSYIPWTNPVFLLGAGTVALHVQGEVSGKNRRYGWVATCFLLLCFIVPVKTFLFLGLSFSLLYWLEAEVGRVPFAALAALFFSSPIFNYAATVFSFPIRLQLTEWVGRAFSLWQKDIHVEGNILMHQGNEFAVDPACMGLHMLSVSLVLGLLLMGILQKKTGRQLSFLWCLAFLAGLVLFNMVANLVRIIILVQFAILPENSFHEITGLICLLLYVCIPAAMLSKWLVLKKGKQLLPATKQKRTASLILLLFLICGLAAAAVRIQLTNTYQPFAGREKQSIPGFRSSVFAPGILKLENEHYLLYIKFLRGFYDTEHHPSMCWKGNGYVLQHIKAEKMGNREVYTAQLVKGKECLYTAWWYDNGLSQTIEQVKWRLDMLKGGPAYAVVNLTAAGEETLRQELRQLMDQKILQPLFHHQ